MRLGGQQCGIWRKTGHRCAAPPYSARNPASTSARMAPSTSFSDRLISSHDAIRASKISIDWETIAPSATELFGEPAGARQTSTRRWLPCVTWRRRQSRFSLPYSPPRLAWVAQDRGRLILAAVVCLIVSAEATRRGFAQAASAVFSIAFAPMLSQASGRVAGLAAKSHPAPLLSQSIFTGTSANLL